MTFKMSKKMIVSPLVIAGAVIGGWQYFGDKANGSAGGRRQLAERPVVGAIAHKEEFGDRLEAIGTLYAKESITVTAKTQGIIRSLDFDDGQTFVRGDQIAAVDAGAEDAALNVELANLEQQKKILERTMQLVADNHVSQAKVDEHTALLKKAEATVAAARTRSGDRRILAPFSGIVGTRRISLGALVTPGTIITTLDDLAEVKLDFSIPETFIATLKPAQALTPAKCSKAKLSPLIAASIPSHVRSASAQ
jgi:membrane fusion protein, multidrug efflux system